jgi:uracil-DNA glycosylase
MKASTSLNNSSLPAMPDAIPASIADQLSLAAPSWRPILLRGLEAVARSTPGYLSALAADDYLPTEGRLFAAFSQPIEAVKYVLIGEGPYPRPESATGVCFMDGAVHSLWSEKGFSKPVNRATSLRNFMKMLLVADGQLKSGQTSGEEVAGVAAMVRENDALFIQTLEELQANLTACGFLLLNASLVFRPHVPPLQDARAWQPFLQTVLAALVDHAEQHRISPPTLVLWGKVAGLLSELPSNTRFPKAVSEHPYNLSFINSATMQVLFGPMHLLKKRGANT